MPGMICPVSLLSAKNDNVKLTAAFLLALGLNLKKKKPLFSEHIGEDREINLFKVLYFGEELLARYMDRDKKTALLEDIELLTRDIFPDESALYLISPEQVFINEIIDECNDIDFLMQQLSIDVLKKESLKENCGWEKKEAEELDTLQPGDMVIDYSCCSHTIIRVR